MTLALGLPHSAAGVGESNAETASSRLTGCGPLLALCSVDLLPRYGPQTHRKQPVLRNTQSPAPLQCILISLMLSSALGVSTILPDMV